MDFDDVTPKKEDALEAVLKEDLSSHSIDELEERIDSLKGEINRVEAVISSKKGSMAAAESVFK